MSILIGPDGNFFVQRKLINEQVAPVTVGEFSLSPEAFNFVEHDLSADTAEQIFKLIPTDMQAMCKQKDLIPTKAGLFQSDRDAMSERRSQASQTPRINNGDEIHFIFGGANRFTPR
ncbi:MAG: hypothetical protein COB66_03685 [Coxiella sp. (in: Bacteria)]|nr:MAG: hypothetical protein COB66_03685 [Coxiella sp. (in: g-proteobacteria)]